MRALRVHELGEPEDVLVLDDDVPDLEPGPEQLVVAVRAAALNFADVLLCRGGYQVKPPLPFTPGLELAGEVVATGGAVTRWKPGDQVVGVSALPAGSLAQQAVMEASDAYAALPGLDAAGNAAHFITYQTAHVGLHRRAGLRAGETLLVHAGAGGVGSAAIQLGKAAGATVIATAGGPAKVALCRQLGADHVVDYSGDDFVDAVKHVTGGRGADVIFDPVGGDVFARSLKVVAFEGRVVIVGFASGAISEARLNHVLVKNYSLLGLHWGLYRTKDPSVIQATHDALTTIAADGHLQPLVSERLPLGEAAAALTRMAHRQTTGKVVILP
ncbi:MAG: NADPH:quinone oxidoreductase family protein [Mycobacteriales bacterium]